MAARRLAAASLALVVGVGAAPWQPRAGESDRPEDLAAPAPAPDAPPPQAGAPGAAHDWSPSPENPLWSVPIETLSAMRDRPLFSPSRRPPPLSGNPASAAGPQTTAPVASAPPQPPPTLLGTIVGSGQAYALLLDPNTNRVVKARPGEAGAGWRVQSIDIHSAVVEIEGRSVTLPLITRQSDAAPGSSAAPIPGKTEDRRRWRRKFRT